MKTLTIILALFLALCPDSRSQSLLRVGSMAPLADDPLTYPRAISPDGSVIVGEELVGGGSTAFSWTAAEEFNEESAFKMNAVESSDPRVYLGLDLNGDPFRSVDGVLEVPAVNEVVKLDDRFSARFTTAGVWETVNGTSLGKVTDVSADGKIFVGNSFSGDHTRAAIWTEDEEFLIPYPSDLDNASARTTRSHIHAISADGSTVVGYSVVRFDGDDFFIGWAWTEEIGMRPILFLLEDLEIDFDQRWAFEEATAVSSDGSVIVGAGFIGGEDADEIWLLNLKPGKIVVNSTGDAPRQAGGNSCFTGATIPGGAAECTLRSAIEAINAGLGDEVEFDIPGGGVPVIAPESPLPEITKDISLDAGTQPGTGRVCLDGQLAGESDGLRLLVDNALVRGFEVVRFDGAGIRARGVAKKEKGNKINLTGLNLLGNYVGTNAAGTSGLGNKLGIFLERLDGAVIGGILAGELNVISGNEDGLVAENCSTLKILHNLMGVAPDGNSPLPNLKKALDLKSVTGLKLGNPFKPTPIMGKEFGAFFKNLENFTVENLHVGVGSDGETSAEGLMEGICIEDSSVGRILGGVFAGVSETSMALIGSEKIALDGVSIGTNKKGFGSLAGKLGLLIEGGGGHEIGKFGGELSVMAGKIAVLMKDHRGLQSIFSNAHLGVDHLGKKVIGDTEMGLMIDGSANVKVRGKSSGGEKINLGNLSLIAGTLFGAEISNSNNIEVCQASINVDVEGETVLGQPAVGINLKDVLNVNLESLLINGVAGLKAAGVGGFSNSFKDLIFNLNGDGDAPLADFMDCAISMEDCSRVVLDAIEIGKAVTGVEISESLEIDLNDSVIGIALADLPEVPVMTGITVTTSENISVKGGEVFAGTGVDFRELDGVNSLEDVQLGLSGAANEMSRALGARSFTEGATLLLLDNHIGGVSGDAVFVEEMAHMVVSGNDFGVDEEDYANEIGGDAVEVAGRSTGVEVTGNTFQNTGEAAVRVRGPGNQVVVRNNEMFGNGFSIVREVIDETLRTLDILEIFQGSTHVAGSIQGEPGETLLVDFYAYDPVADTVEARYYLGEASLTLNGFGRASFSEIFPASAPAGWNATATVTNAEFGTSPLKPGTIIAPAPDSDNDGFPDTWERLHPDCFTVGVVDSPFEDCDHDGLSALDEFIFQTDPGVPDLLPPLIVNRGEGEVTAMMEAKPGRRYTLEFSSDLLPGSWEVVGSEIVFEDGPLEFTHRSDGGEGYYRMRLAIP